MRELVIVMVIALSGCSSVEIIHEPVECLGIPSHNVRFTDEEKASITEQVLTKFEIITTTYKTRIKVQCEINKAHDALHEGE